MIRKPPKQQAGQLKGVTADHRQGPLNILFSTPWPECWKNTVSRYSQFLRGPRSRFIERRESGWCRSEDNGGKM